MIHQRIKLCSTPWYSCLCIPRYIRQEFLHESTRKNNFSLQIICGIIFAAEGFNLVRVVFWSQSGLGTKNNRIYFFMYCTLILVAILWLGLQRCLRRAKVEYQCAAQYVVTSLLFLWNLCLNSYDLYRDPGAGITVLTTALLGLAMFIQMLPWCSVAQFGVDYLLFRKVMAPLLDGGDRLNLTITFMVALTVSLAHAHHTLVTLQQQRQILQMNEKLQELVQLDPLTRLLNKTTVECRAENLLRNLERTGDLSGLTLFLLDLDQFKWINDMYGHPCGDHVLVETADSIRRAFPDAAGLGRVGGDEFAVLYDRPITKEQAAILGEELAKQLQEIQWQGRALKIRCSVGVCICTIPQYSYHQLYTKTDQMLYQAKQTGRGRCCILQLESVDDSQASQEGAQRIRK